MVRLWLRSMATGLLAMVALVALVAVGAMAQTPTPAKPAKLARLALIIGNAAYKDDRLINPVNDAQDVAALFKQAGFEVVYRENASLKEMHLALREFGDRLGRETLGLFYFAGHGVQVRGHNYLLAVDADIGREDEVAFNALDLQAVLEKMDTARNHTNLIILDACRNNPFASRFKLANSGLAQIDAPPGTVVAFSTAPGSVAADGSGRNGLYTKHLLAHLAKPGVRIEDAFKQVRVAVRAESKGLQTPWESTSLESELILKRVPPSPVPVQKPVITRAKSVQPGALPRFEVGDSWEWRVTNHLNNDEVRTRKLRVISIEGDSMVFSNGYVVDLSGNVMSEKIGDKLRTFTPSNMFYVFPLTVGLAWRGNVVQKTGADEFSDLDTKVAVLGEEEIETPAGRFKAMKVERIADWKDRKSFKTGTSRWTYWYTSQAKTALRFERTNTTSDGRVLIRETHELIAFSVK